MQQYLLRIPTWLVKCASQRACAYTLNLPITLRTWSFNNRAKKVAMVDQLERRRRESKSRTVPRVARDACTSMDPMGAQQCSRHVRCDSVHVGAEKSSMDTLVVHYNKSACEATALGNSSASRTASNAVQSVASGAALNAQQRDEYASRLYTFAATCGSGQLVRVLSPGMVRDEWASGQCKSAASGGLKAQQRRTCLKRQRRSNEVAAEVEKEEEEEARAAKERKHAGKRQRETRCCNRECNRKLTNFALFASQYKCRCGRYYCHAHRGVLDHRCTYDWKAEGRHALRTLIASAAHDKLSEKL